MIAGRAFCGWMCPIGTLQDILAGWARRLRGEKSRIRGKKSKARFPAQPPPQADRWLRILKYLVLVVILIASTASVYPPLREICPVRSIFSFQLTTPLLASVLLTFVVTSMLVKRFWCKYLCPMGAMLVIFNKISPLRVFIDRDHCTDCSRCEAEWPVDSPRIPENIRSTECIRCLECLETCAVRDAVTLQLG